MSVHQVQAFWTRFSKFTIENVNFIETGCCESICIIGTLQTSVNFSFKNGHVDKIVHTCVALGVVLLHGQTI